jgi:hypothetical protein
LMVSTTSSSRTNSVTRRCSFRGGDSTATVCIRNWKPDVQSVIPGDRDRSRGGVRGVRTEPSRKQGLHVPRLRYSGSQFGRRCRRGGSHTGRRRPSQPATPRARVTASERPLLATREVRGWASTSRVIRFLSGPWRGRRRVVRPARRGRVRSPG